MAAFGTHDNCPNCGARMAADQRYCLNCGHRRGEPRLPFMDAVSIMDSINAPGGTGGTPPPPPPQESDSSNRWNANAALIAGVATLVLAIGVGFLIGRSGHENNGAAAGSGQVKIVQVGGGGGEANETETGAEETGSESTTGSSGNNSGAESGGKSKPHKKKSEVKENSAEEKELLKEETEKQLHSEGPLAETGVQPGESCEKGTPGCSSGGEFNGNFFGE